MVTEQMVDDVIRAGEAELLASQMKKVRKYKDGDTRDKYGRWAGKVVTVRKEYYALIVSWQKQTGMRTAEFWREALMRGVLDIAKAYGIDASFPPIAETDLVPEVKPKRAFPAWLIRKLTSNG